MPKLPLAPERRRRSPDAAAPTDRPAAAVAGGPAAAIARLQARAGNAAVVARLRDERNAPVDIARIATLGGVKDAQTKLRAGVYQRDDGDDEALEQRATDLRRTIREQTADATIDTMRALNHGRVMYHHNAVHRYPRLTARLNDAVNGYAPPDFFVRVRPFTWVLRTRVSASEALRRFLEPGPQSLTIIECQTAAQAAQYAAILAAVGSERFDRRFGRADAVTPDDQLLKLQKDLDSRTNPLHGYLTGGQELNVQDPGEIGELETTVGGDRVSTPGHRPVRRGGWYYVAGHRDYAKRHPHGIWGGENAIYVGHGDDGVQRFTGFGMNDVTEADLARHLAEEFCAAPAAAERDAILTRPPREWQFVLPRLGDLDSVDQLVLSAEAIRSIDNQWGFERDRAELPADQDLAVQARAKLRQIISRSGAALVQPIGPNDLLRTVTVTRHPVHAQAPLPVVVQDLGTWNAPVQGNVTLRLSVELRLSLGSVTERYARQFGLRTAPELVRAVRDLNPGRFRASPLLPATLRAGAVLSFPNTDSVSKLAHTPGGVQSFGEKLLAIDRIGELADSAV